MPLIDLISQPKRVRIQTRPVRDTAPNDRGYVYTVGRKGNSNLSVTLSVPKTIPDKVYLIQKEMKTGDYTRI